MTCGCKKLQLIKSPVNLVIKSHRLTETATRDINLRARNDQDGLEYRPR